MIRLDKLASVDYMLKYTKDDDITANPYLIGALIYKTLENFLNIVIRTSSHNPELIQERFDAMSREVLDAIYTKYITKLNPQSEYHIKALARLDPELFDHSLYLFLDFYERVEDYEKCAVIHILRTKLLEYRKKVEKKLEHI